MDISKIIPLRSYEQVQKGDWVYGEKGSSVGLCRVTHTDRSFFRYSFENHNTREILGEELRTTVLFRALPFGKIEILAGEEVIDTLDSASKTITP